ncbi:MAG: DUF4238 domain-containing protein [Candidatus Udaeobacter sp.]
MPNNVRRNHHYVCEFLLKNFADDKGKLWIYDSEQQKYWAGNTKSAGFERDLYALTLRGRGRDFGILEKGLEQQIDTPGAVAIRKLVNRQMCDGMEWENFLRFVAAQMVRTPEYIERLKAMEAPIMQEMLERMAKLEPEFREGVRNDMKEAGATDEDVERVIEAVANGKCRAQPTQAWIVASAVRAIPMIQAELKDMHWTFLAVPEEEPELLINDRPVMLAEPGPEDEHSRPLGLRSPNIELVMPMSRRMVAVARRDGPDSFGELVKGSAEIVNARMLSYARRFVFASYRSDDLLAAVVRQRSRGPKLRSRRMQIGEQLVLVSEYR